MEPVHLHRSTFEIWVNGNIRIGMLPYGADTYLSISTPAESLALSPMECGPFDRALACRLLQPFFIYRPSRVPGRGLDSITGLQNGPRVGQWALDERVYWPSIVVPYTLNAPSLLVHSTDLRHLSIPSGSASVTVCRESR